MLRSFAAAVIGLGFLATLLALPPDAADARSYRSHVSAKKKTYWARNKARYRAAMRARKAVPAVAQQAATPGQPLPPKRPLKLLTRADILGSDPARLERLGRRIIVGFQSFDEVRPLVA